MFSLYVCVRAYVCLFILFLCACWMKALPYRLCCCRIVCVRLHHYDMSLMWKYEEQKPSQLQSSPQRDAATTAHAWAFQWVREGEWSREKETEPQATTNTKTIHCLTIMAIVHVRRQLWDENVLSERNRGLDQYCKSIMVVDDASRHC